MAFYRKYFDRKDIMLFPQTSKGKKEMEIIDKTRLLNSKTEHN